MNTRKILGLIAAFAIGAHSFTACKEDEGEKPTPAEQPKAEAKNDRRAGGVYKFAFVNKSKSGYGIISIDNGNITSRVVFDGTTFDGLNPNRAYVAGQNYEVVYFKESGGKTLSFDFAVDSLGRNASISNLSITGADGPWYIEVVKETSKKVSRIFTGTLSGSATTLIGSLPVQGNFVASGTDSVMTGAYFYTSNNTLFGLDSGYTRSVLINKDSLNFTQWPGSKTRFGVKFNGNNAAGTWLNLADNNIKGSLNLTRRD